MSISSERLEHQRNTTMDRNRDIAAWHSHLGGSLTGTQQHWLYGLLRSAITYSIVHDYCGSAIPIV